MLEKIRSDPEVARWMLNFIIEIYTKNLLFTPEGFHLMKKCLEQIVEGVYSYGTEYLSQDEVKLLMHESYKWINNTKWTTIARFVNGISPSIPVSSSSVFVDVAEMEIPLLLSKDMIEVLLLRPVEFLYALGSFSLSLRNEEVLKTIGENAVCNNSGVIYIYNFFFFYILF
jgi:hypothetical protein